jgi:hypothetical protein
VFSLLIAEDCQWLHFQVCVKATPVAIDADLCRNSRARIHNTCFWYRDGLEVAKIRTFRSAWKVEHHHMCRSDKVSASTNLGADDRLADV